MPQHDNHSHADSDGETKKGKWPLFGGTGKGNEAEKRLHRLEELRQDLYGDNSALVEYALNTLFTMLWMEAGQERLAVACALSNAPPRLDKAEAPIFAKRLCLRVQAPDTDPLAIPTLTPLLSPKGAKMREWIEQTLAAILTDALNTIKLMLRQPTAAPHDSQYCETGVCASVLHLAARLKSPALVETTVRLLRLLTSDLAHSTSPFGRQTPELRSLASLSLAALSPDDLCSLWGLLNGSDAAPRRDLLPVLDYINDARSVPYLIKMLEQHAQWPDGEMAAWAAIRALQRLRDRRALPVLRRLIAASERAAAVASPIRTTPAVNPALIQTARRALESIENQRLPKERFFLLRPSQPDPTYLLRPTDTTPNSDKNPTELLRPEAETKQSKGEKEQRGEGQHRAE